MLGSAYTTLRDRGVGPLVSAVLNLSRANFHKHVLGRRFIEKRIHNYQMLLDLEDKGICRSLLLFGTREVDHKIMLERVLKPGMSVFDIGANIGYYVLMELALIGPKGKLIAVEPSPSNVELLNRNLALNGYSDIPVIEGAVSDAQSTKEFFLAKQSNLNTFHDTGTGRQFLSGETIDVNTYTVPGLAEEHGAPDLIRMDVEGHEVEVINGMIDAIAGGKLAPMIIFETHLTRYSPDHDMENTLRRIFALGYKVSSAASSSQSGTAIVEALGYRGGDPVPTDGVERVIYDGIKDEDAITLICKTGGLRTVLLEKKG